ASFFINFVFCNPIFQSRHERRSPIFIPGQLLTVQYNRNRDAINLSPFISVMFFVSVPAIKVTISRTVRETHRPNKNDRICAPLAPSEKPTYPPRPNGQSR